MQLFLSLERNNTSTSGNISVNDRVQNILNNVLRLQEASVVDNNVSGDVENVVVN